jgi:hypothetical protein
MKLIILNVGFRISLEREREKDSHVIIDVFVSMPLSRFCLCYFYCIQVYHKYLSNNFDFISLHCNEC